MCGIVAGYGAPDVPAGERMLARLTHRGPDGRGTVSVGADAWLGHRRLSIVDVAHGGQPLATGTGAVSYTHLTLAVDYSVSTSCVPVSLL